MSDTPADDLELLPPQGLIDDLRALHAAGGDVPGAVDRAVLSAARVRFIRERRRRLVLRFTIIGAGAAAAGILLLATFLPARVQRLARSAPAYTSDAHVTQLATPAESAVAARGGRVTILDAFALARHLKAGDARRPEWDANRDGVIDHRDVDALAMAAVRIEGGS